MRLGQALPRLRADLPAPRITRLLFEQVRRRFRNLKRIGYGAFGATFSAKLFRRPVIIKVAAGTRGLVPLAEAIDSLRREVRILGRLQKYPFVPRVLEVGVNYFVMEDVEGVSLLDLLSKKGLPANVLLSTIVSSGIIASVLHHEGIAHRDLEPRNILLTPKGVVVIDFGVSIIKSDHPKEFKAALEKDIVSLLESVVLVLMARKIPNDVRIILTSTIEKFRKIVFRGKVDEDTAKELSKELLFALAQLTARAARQRELPIDRVKVIAV